MASGPTQNYDDPTLVGWRPRPTLARAVRVGLALLPAAVATGAGLLAVRFLPPGRVGLDPWLWLALEVIAATVLLLVVGRLARRLLPLTTLLRLSLVLPDQVPSRFAAMRRRSSLDALLARIKAGEEDDATVMLELVDALSRHDRATFGHSERVQAYTTLIARELGLGAADAARLGWAAMLHDVGKLTVAPELLNKPGRPDTQEWQDLSAHAAAGGALAAPLARWLGPWASVIDQHHERWDGGGYPRGLTGEQISLGARIVAVADAFDVITSARAYKAPMSADAARAELARCAGSQFDARVVRAFLAVGLGELRSVAGPLALLGTLPVVSTLWSSAPQPLARLAGTSSTVAGAAPGVATAVVVGAGLAIAGPVLTVPTTPPAEAPTIGSQDTSGSADDVAADAEPPSPADVAEVTDENPSTTPGPGPATIANGTDHEPTTEEADDATAPDAVDPGSTGTPAASAPSASTETTATDAAATSVTSTNPPATDASSPSPPATDPGGAAPATGSTSGLPPSADDTAHEAAADTAGPADGSQSWWVGSWGDSGTGWWQP